MTRRDLTRGRTFDAAAQPYDRFRPRYPRELFDDLAVLANVSTTSRILEVGCGPGVATEEMMRRGWSVLGVEPGEQLARAAREKFLTQPFAVEVTTFDAWQSDGRRFDLLFSASAYHWVAPRIRWTKAVEALADHGSIALASNKPLAAGSFHDFSEVTRELRARHGVDDERGTLDLEELRALIDDTAADIGELWEALSPQDSSVVAGDLFNKPVVRVYPWSCTYSTEEALGLLGTYSRFLAMDAVRRTALFEQLAAVVDNDFGGALTRHYATVLATSGVTSTGS